VQRCFATHAAFVAFFLAAIPGCTTPPPANEPAVMANTSLLQGGYLQRTALPNSGTLLPPPPAKDSPAHTADDYFYRSTRALRDGPRWALAMQDAVLKFPDALGTFSCAVGAPIDATSTPRLSTLLRRSASDAALATYGAKNLYQRRRPFLEFKESSCTPQDESRLERDGSYPSGHTAIGWAWALILAEAAPDRADAILSRGYAFGQSRAICGVHWQSDVIEGRVVASSVIARLHAESAFNDDVQAAKAELRAARAKQLPPSRDCQLEAAQLAMKVGNAP